MGVASGVSVTIQARQGYRDMRNNEALAEQVIDAREREFFSYSAACDDWAVGTL